MRVSGTSLSDYQKYPAQDLAALHPERWEVDPKSSK
jgi:hypothetical protein